MLPERDAVASCLLSGLTVSTPACALVRRHDRPGAESMHEVLMLLFRKAQHLTSVNLTSMKQLLITVDIHNCITLAGAIQSDAAYAGDSRIDGDLAKWRRRNSATRRFWHFLRRTLVFASESYR